MTGPCSYSAHVRDSRFSTLATRSPAGEITSDAKVCTGGEEIAGAAKGDDAFADAASEAARKSAISFIGESLSFLEVLAAALRQGSAVRDILVNGGEHDGTVIPVKACRQYFRLKTRDSLGSQACDTDYLASDQRFRGIEGGQLGAGLLDAEGSQVNP